MLQKLIISGICLLTSMTAMASFQPGDLAVFFDTVDTPAKASRLIGLKDLGFTDHDLRAILDHAARKYRIQSEVELEKPKGDLSPFEPQSPERKLILAKKCVNDLGSWKVSAIRIAPFEYQIPGSKNNLDAYFKSKNIEGMDHVFQVRLVLNVLCDELIRGRHEVKVIDMGLHLIYNILPDDENLRAQVLTSFNRFNEASLAGNAVAADTALNEYEKAMTSPAYKMHFATMMKAIGALAQARGSSQANSSALAGIYKAGLSAPNFNLTIFREGEDTRQTPSAKARATAPLIWTDRSHYKNEQYFAAVKAFVQSSARKQNLVRTALSNLVEEEGSKWTLTGLLAGSGFDERIFVKEYRTAAKKAFTSLYPQELKTFQAVVTDDGKLAIRQVTTSGYYVDLGLSHREGEQPDFRGVSIRDEKLFGLTDFYQKPSDIEIDVNNGQVLMPPPSADDKIPLSRLLANPGLINASSTSCVTCHASVSNLAMTKKDGSIEEQILFAFGPEPEEDVRMMGFNLKHEPTIRNMTVNEVALDFKKLMTYLRGAK